ncbi:MAG: triose-phosphate isomerase [Candidatus Polarisedimenticolia bacterium]
MFKPFVLANWKMHKTPSEAEALLSEIVPTMKSLHEVEVAIAPSTLCVPLASRMLSGSGVALAAQDCHWEEEGPFTGQTSPRMLAECGVRYVLLGHSEMREFFGESDHRVSLKARAALFWGMSPIICVGEKKDERDSDRAEIVVEAQLNRCLESVHLDKNQRLLVAYEPVWSIGTGLLPGPADVRSVHHIIRTTLLQTFGEEIGCRLPILYGGSVNTSTVRPMLDLDVVDGVLVGGASLRAETFLPLVREVAGAGPQGP